MSSISEKKVLSAHLEGAALARHFIASANDPDQSRAQLLEDALADLMPATAWNEIEPAMARLRGFAAILSPFIDPALMPQRPALSRFHGRIAELLRPRSSSGPGRSRKVATLRPSSQRRSYWRQRASRDRLTDSPFLARSTTTYRTPWRRRNL